jgi:hypothetical protein
MLPQNAESGCFFKKKKKKNKKKEKSKQQDNPKNYSPATPNPFKAPFSPP